MRACAWSRSKGITSPANACSMPGLGPRSQPPLTLQWLSACSEYTQPCTDQRIMPVQPRMSCTVGMYDVGPQIESYHGRDQPASLQHSRHRGGILLHGQAVLPVDRGEGLEPAAAP